MEKARLFFENYIGTSAIFFVELPQSGSNRRNYIAKSSDKTYVVTYNENLSENESFFYFSSLFSKLNLNTPKIFEISENRNLYIQEFLGSKTLSQIIEEEGLSSRVKILVKKTVQRLFELQIATQNKIDYSKTFEYEQYDEMPILHDLNYFKFMFVDILEIDYHKSTLLKEFRKLTEKIENLQPKSILIRDFQARNILVNDQDHVFFIDYQSAMEGPLMYDVISFLYQAKANFPDAFREEMIEFYYSLFEDENEIQQLKNSVMPIRLIRNLQVLGAYGFRGLIQRKEHFLKSISKGIENVAEIANNWSEMNNYPELKLIIEKVNSEKIQEKINLLIEQ